MSIYEELKRSEQYLFKTIGKQDGLELVALTVDNVARAEAMLINDSTYKQSFDTKAKPEKYARSNKKEYKYGGSTAYWLTQLKDILINDQGVQSFKKEESSDGFSFDIIIKNAVNAIDRENSTRLNTDGKNGRNEISSRIINNRSNLINWLKNPKATNYKIIEVLASKTKGANEKKGKKNPSFASKFAHYACFYLFEGEDYQDNFSIYDSVLRKALPLYLKKYEIAVPHINEDYTEGDYKKYQTAIDELREKVKQNNNEIISRNGLDHLLWYAHK